MTGLIRRCPKCKEARPLNEIVCQTPGADRMVLRLPAHQCASHPERRDRQPPIDLSRPSVTSTLSLNGVRALCPNGHDIEEGDRICMTCGAQFGAPATEPEPLMPRPHADRGLDRTRTLEDEAARRCYSASGRPKRYTAANAFLLPWRRTGDPDLSRYQAA